MGFPKKFLPGLIAALLWAAPDGASAGSSHRSARATSGQIGLALGHQQAFGLNFPAFNPTLEFRAGYQVSDEFLARIDLGAGGGQVGSSQVASFEGAWILNIHLGLLLAWTPTLSENLNLTLGGVAGVWFISLYGDDLTGVLSSGQSGSPKGYLEAADFSAGAVVGLEYQLSNRWALSFEVRYLWAQSPLGSYKGNLAGLTGTVGFIYRMASWDIETPH